MRGKRVYEALKEVVGEGEILTCIQARRRRKSNWQKKVFLELTFFSFSTETDRIKPFGAVNYTLAR